MCSTDYVANATSIKHCRENQPGRASPPAEVFVGGYTRRVTPVPIPNTVVKPAGPMILLQRESRSLPALNRSPRGRKISGASFLRIANRKRLSLPQALKTQGGRDSTSSVEELP